MKLFVLLPVCVAAVAVVSPTSVPAPTTTHNGAITVTALAPKKDCTTYTPAFQQFNNNMTSTVYLKTKTKTRTYDCHGCHHITTSWVGWSPPHHHQPTTVTVKKTTTTVALCSISPTPSPKKLVEGAEAETPETKTQDVKTLENETPENEVLEVEMPTIESEEIESPEDEVEELELSDEYEVVDF